MTVVLRPGKPKVGTMVEPQKVAAGIGAPAVRKAVRGDNRQPILAAHHEKKSRFLMRVFTPGSCVS